MGMTGRLCQKSGVSGVELGLASPIPGEIVLEGEAYGSVAEARPVAAPRMAVSLEDGTCVSVLCGEAAAET